MASYLKCPHCGYEPEYGVRVCRGCQAEIVYGPFLVTKVRGGCGFTAIGVVLLACSYANGIASSPQQVGYGFIACIILFFLGYGFTSFTKRAKITFRRAYL